jgi:hypothetical protein
VMQDNAPLVPRDLVTHKSLPGCPAEKARAAKFPLQDYAVSSV